MKHLYRLLTLTGLFATILFLTVNLESCSSHKGIVSCPDVHHRNLAMHHVHYHNGNALAHNHHKNAGTQQATNTTPKQANTDAAQTLPAPNTAAGTDKTAVAPSTDGGMAAASTGLPKFKNPKELFKILTSDERQQVKAEMSTMLAKHPMLQKMAEKRMAKLDKKYPAPAKSSLGSGGLGTGEILAIVAAACAIFFFLGIVSLVLGIIALHMINKNGGANWAKILAILAIILGALEIVGLILYIVFVAIAVHQVGVI